VERVRLGRGGWDLAEAKSRKGKGREELNADRSNGSERTHSGCPREHAVLGVSAAAAQRIEVVDADRIGLMAGPKQQGVKLC
jgi:hypothetical protein